MPPNLDWGQLMKVDPDALSGQERLADKLLLSLSKVESNDLKESDHDKLVQLFRITQALMKMKAQEVDLAVEEVEKAGEEQATIENQLKSKVIKLENELENDQLRQDIIDYQRQIDSQRETLLSRRGGDSDFRSQLSKKNLELVQYLDEIQNLTEANEKLEVQNHEMQKNLEESVNEMEKMTDEYNKMKVVVQQTDIFMDQLSKEKEHLRLQVQELTEQIQARTEEDDPVMAAVNAKVEEWKSVLSAKDDEIIEYQQMLRDLKVKLKTAQLDSDKNNVMALQQNDQLRQDIIDYQRQIDSQRETLLSRRGGDSDFRSQLSKKNLELVQYLDEIQNLTEANEKLEVQNHEMQKNLEESVNEMEKMTDEYNKMKVVVQQTDIFMDQLSKEKEHLRFQVQELTEQIQARTEEDDPVMAAVNAKVEEWKSVLSAKDDEIIEYQQMLRDLKVKLKTAQLDSDKNNVMALQQAVQERDSQIKMLTDQVEQYTSEMERNALVIEDLKKQLQKDTGLNPKEIVDLTEFRRTKALKQQQYCAENQILLKEIERLEEERLELKKHIRRLAKDKGKRAAALGLTADDLQLVDDFTENLKSSEKLNQIPYTDSHEQIKHRNEHLLKELHDKEKELELKRTELAQLKSKSKNTMEENKQLEQGMKEILQAIKDTQKDSKGETGLSIPILERLVNAIETKSSEGVYDANVHLKAQVDQLTGRNDELRKGMKEARKEAASAANQLEKANEKAYRMENEIQMLRQSGLTADDLQLVDDFTENLKSSEKLNQIPYTDSHEQIKHRAIETKSSEGVFDANVHLKAQVDQLTGRNDELRKGMKEARKEAASAANQLEKANEKELHNKEESMMKLEEALEEYKRKFAVIRHQQGLLYKEYQSERELWQKDTEKMRELQDKLGEQKEQDAAKIQEYNRWLDVLQKDPDEIKKQLAEAARKMTVLRVNEKSLTRHYTTLLEMEQHLRKENNKLKNEMIAMEAAVAERDMAAFKIAALQKALNDSVPSADLEKANKQYNDLTTKYRDMLQKDNLLVQKTTNLEHLEGESAVLRGQIDALNKELEITKEKLHTLEQAWEQITKLGGESAMDKATKAITNGEIVSISKKITTLEMKELNERQRAEHAHKMYEHLRSSFKQVEDRNFELETKFAELTKQNLEAQRIEQELRDELANSVSKAVSDADRRRIMELEKTEADLKIEVSKLRDVSDVAKMQTSALEARQQSREKEVEALRKLVLDYQKLKEKEAALWKAEQNVLSRDRVINELRLRLPATAEREKLIAELGRREEDPEFQQALKVAHQTIANLQARLNQKEDVLKKYQHLQAKARQDQEEVAKKHEEELRLLHQKLDLHSDTSLNKFKQTALELMKKPSIVVPTTKHLARLAEMEQTVAEQDNSLSNITDKLKRVTAELEKQKQITVLKMKEHANEKAKLEERHVAEVKKLKENVAELRTLLSQMENEVHYLRTELEAQKEANTRAPTTTMKSLVERLKAQLALKEKQQKALSKALLELRSEMTAHAEYQIVASASQKEENLNVQQIVDKHTKELKFRIEDLNEQLLTAKENLKESKNKENSLKEEMDSLNRDLNRSYKAHKKLQSEKEELDKENEELKKRIKRLASSMQIKSDSESKQSTVDELQKKIKRLETELERKATSQHAERKIIKEDKTSKEEIVRWEEGKKWQARTEGMRNKLKEKEKEVESLTKQLSTIKDLYTRLEQEKASLQKKIKGRGVTVDQVVGVRTLESEKEIEELKGRNSELENHIVSIKKQQALPRDSAMEDLNLKNRYLEEKLHALERQLSKDTHSRPSCNSIFPDCAITNTSEKIADFKSGNVNIKSYESEDKSKNVGNINWDGVIFSEEVESALKVEKEDQSTSVALDSKLETEVAENRDRFAAAEDNKAESETDRVSPSKTEEIPIHEEQPEAVESNPQEVDPFGDIGGKIESPCGKDRNRNPSNASEHAVTSTDETGEGDNTLTNEQSGNNTEDTNKAQQQDEKEEPAASLVSESQNQNPACETGEEEEKLSNEHSGSHAKESVDAVDETQENSEKEEPTEDDINERLELKPDDVNETSGMGSDSHSQKDDEIQRENLKLSSENMELRFQLEQASKDLPRFKDKVADLKEMCDLLKKEKTEIEKKLGNVRGSGRSGKTVPELEKTIGLMKKVVERVQRENEELKKAPGVESKEKLAGLERENEKLKSEFEKLKLQMGGHLSMRYESKTKGMEKIVAENERLRKELKKEAESAEKLKIAKNNLEIMNEKLMVQLEETSKRLSFAESRGPQLEDAESKSWKSIVVTRMYESKMKELETDIDKKNKSLSDLKQLLREATEREQKTEHCISDLKEQVELLKHFPEEAKTEPGLIRELQLIRLTNDRLEKEKTELVHQLQVYRQQIGATTEGAAEPGYDELLEKCIKHDKMMGDLVELQTQVKAADLDKRHLQEEVKKMKKELENFDPTFFEEIEDLKYNYNQEVKRNILLEEQLKKLSDQFGVQVNIPANTRTNPEAKAMEPALTPGGSTPAHNHNPGESPLHRINYYRTPQLQDGAREGNAQPSLCEAAGVAVRRPRNRLV
ncbi:UNVERIFIED_CONTAM: hypothetical protein FKN15_031020 [Acipenser sinensis]